MSTGAKSKPDGILGLSGSEAKVLILGFACLEDSQFKIDYDILAQKGGYKNGASASTLFRGARRKLNSLQLDGNVNANGNGSSVAPGEASIPNSAANTPKKGQGKRKKAAAATGESEAGAADGEAAETPKPKRQRKTPVKKGIAVKIKKDQDESSDEIFVKPEAIENIKTEEEEESDMKPSDEYDEIMTDANLDAEFDAMDKAKVAVKAETVAA